MINSLACAAETLPWLILQLARGSGRVQTIVEKISDRQKYNGCSDHDAPPVGLSLDIDAKVTAQMRVRAFAFKVAGACIHMSFTAVIKVILSSIFSHRSTSIGCLVL
jgi:hypothetical protein